MGFGTRLFMWKYLMRLSSSVWASFWSAWLFSAVVMRVVSSAYVQTVEFGTVLMSLM